MFNINFMASQLGKIQWIIVFIIRLQVKIKILSINSVFFTNYASHAAVVVLANNLNVAHQPKLLIVTTATYWADVVYT